MNSFNLPLVFYIVIMSGIVDILQNTVLKFFGPTQSEFQLTSVIG